MQREQHTTKKEGKTMSQVLRTCLTHGGCAEEHGKAEQNEDLN